MIATALLSLVTGTLTVLMSCVLPFLPVIIDGSLGHGPRHRPYLIAALLVVSLLVFTLLLKTSTAFLNIDPRVWIAGSGVLVILLEVTMLFPGPQARAVRWTKLEAVRDLLGEAHSQRGETAGAFLTSTALGPVFSSCLPTYTWVIVTVLSASPVAGIIYLGIYCAGMARVLLGISPAGRRFVGRFGWASNPCGWFQHAIAALFVVAGLFVFAGLDRVLQVWAVDKFPALTTFEQGLIPQSSAAPGVAGSVEQRQLGPVSELADISHWVNSNPTTPADLRGKAMLVDFWTYSCINCTRTQSYLNAWYDRYRAAGPGIVDARVSEFTFEKMSKNAEKAVHDTSIKHPMALGNNFVTWYAYYSQCWPAEYLIDKDDNVRQAHFDEGSYDKAEKQICGLLGEAEGKAGITGETIQSTQGQSSGTYPGIRRTSGSETRLEVGERDYSQNPAPGATNQWNLSGNWAAGDESITAAQDRVQLNYRPAGHEMFLVMNGPTGAKVCVQIEDGGPLGGTDMQGEEVTISGARLYRLARLPETTRGTTVTLTFDKGASASAFTFG